MDEVKKIIADIDKRNLKPIYFLMGEEPYYIDNIADYIEAHVLTEEEKGFNQSILYGRDVSIDDIAASAKRFPMMAEYQVLIVKEAQDLSRSIEKLVHYVKNPQPTTILVFCYKYKKIDKRKSLYKALKENSVVFESKKLYDNKVPDWIKRNLHAKGYTISPKAAHLLVEFLGTDLGKINNELEKLQLILPENTQITPAVIEENIGISKDFNNFELQKALGYRDFKKAYRIINYFSQNPKDNNILMTLPILFRFFSQVLQYHGLRERNPKSVASALGVHPFFVDDYVTAAKNYPMKKVSAIIAVLRDLDAKNKGIGAQSLPQADLLKELLIKVSA